MNNSLKKISSLEFILIVFVCVLVSTSYISKEIALALTTSGNVNITNSIPIGSGGTGTFTTPTGSIMTLTLPAGVSGTLQVETTNVANPTADGLSVKFLAEILHITLNPSDACANGCIITFTFTDEQLMAAGITDPSIVKIFQDPQQDGTFIILPTTLVDGAPSPYTVSATITSTSFFGIGVTEPTFCGKTIDQFDHVIDGTEKDNTLTGTKGDDLIRGFEGDDRIRGRDGDDCLVGGAGNDAIIGGHGNDTIDGGDGNDTIFGGGGNDVIFGNSGNDRIDGGNGNDSCDGGSGNNSITKCEH